MSAKIATRFGRDRRALAAAFGPGLGRPVAIEPGWGDPHRGGQSVARVTCESGIVLGYKPRSVEPERFWAQVIARVDRHLRLGLAAPRALDRGDHGWVEWIEADDRLERAATRSPSFWVRTGAVLALADLLEIRDAHRDNFVLARGQPILVDCETIGHPRLPGFEGLPSLVLTGMLPWPPGTEGSLLDSVRTEAQRRRLMSGYRRVHRLVRRLGMRWLGTGGTFRPLASGRVRVILRPTREYVDALRRGVRLRPLPVALAAGAARKIQASERRALGRGDIPIFEADVTGTALRSEDREIVPGFFERSAWTTMVARFERLDRTDEQVAVRLLRSSLTIDQLVRRLPESRMM